MTTPVLSRITGIRLPATVFFGWWIVLAGNGIQIINSALFIQAYGSYLVFLREDFGWSKTMLSAAYSMSSVESGVTGPLHGWLTDRFGPRAMIRAGSVTMAAGFFLFSLIQTPLQFFGAFLVIAVGSNFGSFPSLTVAVLNWFERRRGTAMGLLNLGLAIGGLTVPLLVWSLDSFGWRMTARASAVLVLVVCLPLAQVIRHRPESYGLRPDGRVDDDPRQGSSAVPRPFRDEPQFTAAEALRTPAFWLLSSAHALALMLVIAVMVHLVVYLKEDLAYSVGAAGIVVAVMTGSQMVGQVLGGYLGDRFPKRLVCSACMVVHVVALLLLAYASATWMVVVFAVGNGVAWGVRGPLATALRADYFGRSSIGMIMGLSSMVTMLGTVSGPLTAGVLADQTGGYRTGFTIIAIVAALGSVLFWAARPPRKPARLSGLEAAVP